MKLNIGYLLLTERNTYGFILAICSLTSLKDAEKVRKLIED